MRPITSFCMTAIPILLVACGPPAIYDTSHRLVRNPLITASVDNGWLAVDSTEAGIRAVVHLQLAGPADASESVSLHLLRFHCAVSGEHLPSSVMQEEPRCPAFGSRPIRCPEGASPGECDTIRDEAEQTCVYTIRAEFLFDQLPHLNENQHFFTFGQTDQPILWAKAPGY